MEIGTLLFDIFLGDLLFIISDILQVMLII